MLFVYFCKYELGYRAYFQRISFYLVGGVGVLPLAFTGRF